MGVCNSENLMESVVVSKFKLNLQTLISEIRQLREKEGQLENYIEKQKQRDEELSRKTTQLEAELASSIDLGQKLQRKVQFLEDDNHLLQTKHTELKETINTILEAKQAFLKAYQDSTCEMKRSIETRDRKITMLSDKINAHLSSIDSIRKEAYFVNQLVDNAQRAVDDKEEVVARLKIEMDKACTFENLFIEKINCLETKLKCNESEFQRKDRMIAELQTQLATPKIIDQCQLKIDEIQETLLMKEGIIGTLMSENKALRSELGILEVTFKTIQDTMTRMDEEDRVAFSLILANQEKDAIENDKEDARINNDIHNCEASSHHKASRATVEEIRVSPSCKEHTHIASPSRENNKVNSCVSESTFSPTSSVHSESQPEENATDVPAAIEKEKYGTYIQQLDSECSTTQAGKS